MVKEKLLEKIENILFILHYYERKKEKRFEN